MYSFLLEGGIFMLPLLLFSLYAFTWFFQVIFTILDIKNLKKPALQLILDDFSRYDNKKNASYLDILKDHDDSIFHFFTRSNSLDFDEWTDKKLSSINSYLKHSIPRVEFIIHAAPIFGILGTVVGIIITFEGLDVSSVESFDVIIKGISQALNTTAYGLFISIFLIICLSVFNYFINKKRNEDRILLNKIYNFIIHSSEFNNYETT